MIERIAKIMGLSDDSVRGSSFLNRLIPDYVLWMPVAFTVAIINQCNLKCTICSRTIYGVENTKMSKDIFLKASTYFQNSKVNIVGAGEPLLHPDLFDFIKICYEKKCNVRLITNGTLLSEDKAKNLLKYSNLEALAFSIDGVKDNYNKVRRGSNFDAVISNLIRFSELRKDVKVKPKIVINFVGMKYNLDDFPKLITLLGSYVDSMELIHPLFYSLDTAKDHLNQHIEYAMEVFAESRRIAQEKGVILILPPLGHRARGCIYPWTLPTIGMTGDVYPCHVLGCGDHKKPMIEFYDDTSILFNSGDHCLGNIMNTDFNLMWNGNKIRKFRKMLSEINIHDLSNKDNDYDSVRREWTPETFYCKVCPNRWDCAC
jgi:MoaA/NifB/PqqE/SkfB family radical SAM enzyme